MPESENSLRALKAGDLVMVPKGYRSSEHEAQLVERVGRRWLYVGNGYSQLKFDRDTGSSSDYNGGQAFRPEGLAVARRRAEVMALLRPLLGSYSWERNLTTDQLEAILAILQPEQGDDA